VLRSHLAEVSGMLRDAFDTRVHLEQDLILLRQDRAVLGQNFILPGEALIHFG
jgi:hypothetical protein